jgi:hypothetical protein
MKYFINSGGYSLDAPTNLSTVLENRISLVQLELFNPIDGDTDCFCQDEHK